MSLTQTHHVFAGVTEGGINAILKALFTTRPHLRVYGSNAFVPTSTVNATNIAPIPFPGVPGGIQWAVVFNVPVVDLFPDSSGGASPLPPGPNQLNIHTTARIVLGCATWNSQGGERGNGGKLEPVLTTLDAWALGTIQSQYYGPGTGNISFDVIQVKLPGILPASLELLLECLIRMLLSAIMEQVRIPFNTLSAGAFQLILEQGPEIDDNQVKVWGDI